jgi:hypothetical protein
MFFFSKILKVNIDNNQYKQHVPHFLFFSCTRERQVKHRGEERQTTKAKATGNLHLKNSVIILVL